MYQIMGEGYRGTVSVYGNTSERIHVMVICINNHDDTMSISQDCSLQDLLIKQWFRYDFLSCDNYVLYWGDKPDYYGIGNVNK